MGNTLGVHINLHKKGVRIAQDILSELNKNSGFLPFHDKTDADEIYNRFGVSKKVFKAAIGHLYKQRKIYLSDNGIMSV